MKFIDKQLALKLKEKGFDKPCFGFYNFIQDELQLYCSNDRDVTYKNLLTSMKNNKVNFDAPTTDQVLEWLRDKNVHISLTPYFTPSTKNNIMWGWEILLMGKVIDCKNTLYTVRHNNFTKLASANCCESYDDACVDAIEFAIDNLI